MRQISTPLLTMGNCQPAIFTGTVVDVDTANEFLDCSPLFTKWTLSMGVYACILGMFSTKIVSLLWKGSFQLLYKEMGKTGDARFRFKDE
uniref:Transmembrane protein n=1 Tax=Angiostrongylus cantonensis TaxID=6313 RepID=A0A0K0D047_ANGCA